MKINTNVTFEIRGARGIGKTRVVTTVIIPALEAAGYKVKQVGAERWQFDLDEDGKLSGITDEQLREVLSPPIDVYEAIHGRDKK
jgi:molybdopterin-guanine dinucleotide biosynthesis protein